METVDEWSYSPLNNLITTGIYSYQDITNFNKMVLFQLDGRSIMRTVAHQAGCGQNAQNNQGLTLDGMISEEKIQKTVDGWWKKGTGYLISFGTFSAGFIGLYWIFKVTKWAFDTFFLGSILYDLYGFSWRLIAGFWDSLSNYLTYRATKPKSPITHTDSEIGKIETDIFETDEKKPDPTAPFGEKSIYPIFVAS
jgi:hypothetical protein